MRKAFGLLFKALLIVFGLFAVLSSVIVTVDLIGIKSDKED